MTALLDWITWAGWLAADWWPFAAIAWVLSAWYAAWTVLTALGLGWVWGTLGSLRFTRRKINEGWDSGYASGWDDGYLYATSVRSSQPRRPRGRRADRPHDKGPHSGGGGAPC